jgi:chromate transporter
MTGTLFALARVFTLLSLTSFGGGNVTIPEIERQAVVVHHWVTEQEFLEAFALSRAAPGPSTLFVLLVGARAAGRAGAVVATTSMFLPGAVLMLVACAALDRWKGRRVAALLAAFRPVTIGLLFATVAVLGHAAVVDRFTLAVAAGAAAATLLTRLPVAALLVVAAAAGWLAR